MFGRNTDDSICRFKLIKVLEKTYLI